MKAKGIFKLISNDKERWMHYIIDNEEIVTISLNDTQLITDIKNNIPLYGQFDLKSPEKILVKIDIITDLTEVKHLFDKMLEMNNTYFKEYNDNLVKLVIKIIK